MFSKYKGTADITLLSRNMLGKSDTDTPVGDVWQSKLRPNDGLFLKR